jgi:Cyclin
MASATITESLTSPPPPPNPSEDAGLIPQIASPLNTSQIPSPPIASVLWDANSIRPEVAMKMLCRSVQALAAATGDVPPTPPIPRPVTPRQSPRIKGSGTGRSQGHKRSSSRPATPVPDSDIKAPNFRNVDVGSPEACFSEPAAAYDSDVGADAPPPHIQQEAIARKFFSKAPSPVSLEDYLARLQRYCPMSTAVYLAAGVYIHKLAVEDKLVPVTARTIHRLVLASLRVAMKALEDLRYPQHRFAGVGGVKESELRLLEISLCYLTNFELQVDNETLYKKTIGLQQAAMQANMMRGRWQDTANMRLRLPTRIKGQVATPMPG